VYFNTVYWFRVVFVHLIPCSVLVVLTVLLVCTVRRAQQRKRRLLRPRALSRSEAAAAAAATTHEQFVTITDHHRPGHAGRISSRRTPTTCRLAADTAN